MENDMGSERDYGKNNRLYITVCTISFLAVLLTFSYGYASEGETAPVAHELLDGTVWTQTALEHDVIVYQTYMAAKGKLDKALADPNWTAALEQSGEFSQKPPAIILDVDETVLDNSAFEARCIVHGYDFNPDTWNEWVMEAQAPALPGAKEFLAYATSKGVAVFLVTNRDQSHQQATIDNLLKEVYPDASVNNVLCKNGQDDWTSQKTNRRAFVANDYRILMLFGDDFNDLALLDAGTSEQRKAAGFEYKEYFAEKWVQLPNPLYGSWERAVYYPAKGLTDQEKIEMKYKALDIK
jgi:5'-nucleotidase (lipoprotein e(P4) family)